MAWDSRPQETARQLSPSHKSRQVYRAHHCRSLPRQHYHLYLFRLLRSHWKWSKISAETFYQESGIVPSGHFIGLSILNPFVRTQSKAEMIRDILIGAKREDSCHEFFNRETQTRTWCRGTDKEKWVYFLDFKIFIQFFQVAASFRWKSVFIWTWADEWAWWNIVRVSGILFIVPMLYNSNSRTKTVLGHVTLSWSEHVIRVAKVQSLNAAERNVYYI